jgi:INO80 complex subunit C
LHSPRPFKNPNYTKNINRRAKNLKTVLAQERERERVERERKRAEREEMKMDVDGDGGTKRDLDVEDDVPSCLCFTTTMYMRCLAG